jgi:ABC-type dipeptide/oligopeptide/nickel transport system permease subunit
MTDVGIVAAGALTRPRSLCGLGTASVCALMVLAFVVVAAALGRSVTPYAPEEASGPPIDLPSAAHRLGTNDLGQDLLSLLLYGARASLAVGVLTAVASTSLSAVIGIGSVLFRGASSVLLAVTDALLAIPHLPIIVLVIALLGPGPLRVIGVLALLSWPAFARVVRAQVLTAIHADYVEAARALGATDGRIVRTCLLPDVMPLLWTKFLLTVRWAILMEAALALMGLGDPSQASWGSILQSAFSYPLLFSGSAWLWWALPPAAAVALITLALSVLGQDFDAWLNPSAGGTRR